MSATELELTGVYAAVLTPQHADLSPDHDPRLSNFFPRNARRLIPLPSTKQSIDENLPNKTPFR